MSKKVMIDNWFTGVYILPMAIERTCICGNHFYTIPAKIKVGKGKFCSKRCAYDNFQRRSGLKYNLVKENPTSFKKGNIPWNKGKNVPIPSLYKGEKASRSSIHKWVYRWFGKPTRCEECGVTKNIQWSNKTEEYKRERENWQMLCIKCHHKYDYNNFGHRKVFYE